MQKYFSFVSIKLNGIHKKQSMNEDEMLKNDFTSILSIDLIGSNPQAHRFPYKGFLFYLYIWTTNSFKALCETVTNCISVLCKFHRIKPFLSLHSLQKDPIFEEYPFLTCHSWKLETVGVLRVSSLFSHAVSLEVPLYWKLVLVSSQCQCHRMCFCSRI